MKLIELTTKHTKGTKTRMSDMSEVFGRPSGHASRMTDGRCQGRGGSCSRVGGYRADRGASGSWIKARCQVALLALAFGLPGRATVFDHSPPLQDPEASYSVGLVSYSIFDPEQNDFMRDSAASGAPGLISTNHGVVAWSSGGIVYCRVYDPGRTNWAGVNAATGGGLDFRNDRGIVAWSSGAAVHARVYEPDTGEWAGLDQASAATYNLRVSRGVVSWSTAAGVYYAVYDPSRRAWLGAATAGSTLDLNNTDGVVTWSSGGVVFYAVYDPSRGAWMREQAATGSTASLRNDGGVVAWGSGSGVFCRVYDPRSQLWVPDQALLGFPSNLAITNGVVTWSIVGGTVTRGYNPLSSAWTNSATLPLAHFAVSTNRGAAPHRVRFMDMSVGGTAWTWAFGDGDASFLRAPTHIFTDLGQFTASLRVSNPRGNSTFATNIVTDVEPPAGTIAINDGAVFTTNRIVLLSLSATDNSGLVPEMRLRNSDEDWGAWVPCQTEESWSLSEGNGQKTVEAQYRDAVLNESAVASAAIELDATPPPHVDFEFNATNLLEGVGTFTVPVWLSSPFTRKVTVRVATSGGTAQPGVHYVPVDTVLEYSKGFTRAEFDLTILANAEPEPNRTLELTLSDATHAIPGAPLILTILDDDPARVRFQGAAQRVNEGAGNAVIPVILETPSGLPVSVGYYTTNGTAEAGVDYVPVAGRLDFAPNQTQASFSVPVLDNALDQLDRTVELRLVTPTNAVLSTPAVSVLTIEDNDPPTVNLTSAEHVFRAGAGAAEIGVRLSKPGRETILVDHATQQGGTAVPGVDYIAVSDTLVFSPGQTNKAFLVTVLADPDRSSPRTVWLKLNGALNASMGPLTSGVLRIDDAAPPLLRNPRIDATGRFRMDIQSAVGAVLQVQSATGFGLWQIRQTLTNHTGMVTYQGEPASAAVELFYRVRLLR